MEDLVKAMNFAAVAHLDQATLPLMGGEPMISHSLAVTEVLTSVGGIADDSVLLQAALLHKTVNLSRTVSLEELEETFGAEVAGVVREVTTVDKGGKLVSFPQTDEDARGMSHRAKAVVLASILVWMRTTYERMSKEFKGVAYVAKLQMREAFDMAVCEVDKYRGTNDGLELELDNLIAKRRTDVNRLTADKKTLVH